MKAAWVLNFHLEFRSAVHIVIVIKTGRNRHMISMCSSHSQVSAFLKFMLFFSFKSWNQKKTVKSRVLNNKVSFVWIILVLGALIWDCCNFILLILYYLCAFDRMSQPSLEGTAATSAETNGRKRASKVWKYFKVMKVNAVDKAECQHCKNNV